ncbi:peptidoglycan DD-metalloendopeptidase family protein [Flavobacterium sp. UGB4466]|uniref:glycoside hydrolase family protein n=1 Tax=Flavobacterium sp. UGB4466 TaxID=2730889 RepID=UPI00192B6220|nr:peptidoglycan DD-metalloendopeptidase family protein [Flavobacterium sp. UGB4466]
MSKNVIHNFDILIQDSADVKSAEHLTDVMIKELAKISKEMSQQKDIEQLWQEQKSQNPSVNNSNFSAEGGVNDTIAKAGNNTALSVNNTPSVFGEAGQAFNDVTVLPGTIPFGTTNFNTSIGEGVAGTINSTMMSTVISANTTSPIFGVEDDTLNLGKGVTSQIYSGVEVQQMLTIPEKLQTNGEPTLEVVKQAIRKKIEQANAINDRIAVEYWTKISKALDEDKGVSVQDFDGKPNHALFTEMYAALKQLNSVAATQNFNWEIVREKMIKAIDTNILLGEISEGSKKRWETIRDQLKKDTINVANLFEQYNELFLLLGQVEGLDDLPGTITITTKTKIYPNLSADRLYGKIGREAVYVFLKEISSIDAPGNAVKNGAVKIKNTTASSFIVGESLEFFLDETLIVHNGNKNEGINWIVYKARKGKKYEETIFEDEGTSFSYNFDAEGAYIIEAYGYEHGANSKKNKKPFAFTEVKIVAQELVILPPSTVKGRLVRPSAKEFIFKTALKYPKVKSLNPLKLYYQIESKINNKGTTISDEKELDSTGNISVLMPDLGTYKIKIISKDQYALTQEFEVSAIKNEVTSIGPIKGESNKNVFLLGGSDKTFTLEAKTFKIPPTDKEKQDVKWIVYDSKNNPYLTSGDIWYTEKGAPKRKHLHKWESFGISVPDKEGHYTIEAFSDAAKGVDAKATFKMEVQRPQVTEAYWAYSNGDKKETSGFSGEVNHVKAKIPDYDNQKVRINFYLNGSKEPSYYNETTTNESGEINKIITFDDTFQKRFGVQEGKTAKITFKLMGIQNGRLYPFKRNADVNTTAVLNVVTSEKITAAYFQYDGKRVTAQDEIPLSYDGEYVTIVAKTQNMIGKEIVLTSHKKREKPNFRSKVKIDSEGNASATFKITRLKGTKVGEKWSYYVGIEGHSTKHLAYKGLNMVVGESIKKKEIIFPLLEKPTNNTGSKWGKNYNWTAADGHNQATFDSYRDYGARKHGGRDLYTEKNAEVIAIADGKVLETAYFYSQTNQVTVLHKLKDGRKFIARYGELNPKSIKVKKNDIVKQGDTLGQTGKLVGVTVITGQDIYMLHFEIFSTENGENLDSPLTNTLNGSPFKRRKDLIDSVDILVEGYKNAFNGKQKKGPQGNRMDIQKMRLSEKGKKFIKDWEQFKPHLYNDDAKERNCSIGYGHLVHKFPCNGSEPQEFKDGIDIKRATELFEQRVIQFEKAVKRDIHVYLYQNEFDALVSLLYNTGQNFLNVGGLNDGVTKIKKKINLKDYEGGADEMGDVTNGGLEGLVVRRKAEIKMFKYNVYDSNH